MSESSQIRAQNSLEIAKKLAKLPNKNEIKSNVSLTNQKIAERNILKSNFSAIKSFLEDQEQTPETKKKLVKINL